MSGWQWFWTLVGFIIYIIVLIFLYFFKPFEDLFNIIINGIGFDNAIFWAVVIIGIVGFCAFHWRAYRYHIVQQKSVEAMVLASLRGSAFAAILFSAGATLQAVQILCTYLLSDNFTLGREFGQHLAAIIALIILTGVFCIIFWLLKIIRDTPGEARA
jgi:hypothetical protein